jgi:hypothetical protein
VFPGRGEERRGQLGAAVVRGERGEPEQTLEVERDERLGVCDAQLDGERVARIVVRVPEQRREAPVALD